MKTEEVRQRVIDNYSHQPEICFKAGINKDWLHAFRYGRFKNPGHDTMLLLIEILDEIEARDAVA